MFPLVTASVQAHSGNDILFGLDRGWTCRVMVLDEGLIRVLFTPPDGLREPRTWSIAPGGKDVGWEGRDRLDRSGFACPSARIEHDSESAVIHTNRLQVTATLNPFGLSWATAERIEFAADRPTQAYQASERTTTLRHWMARELDRQYFGLGDKTGPLNQHGRRLRTLQLDALGHDARTSDPLYKHWPFTIGRDPGSGVAYGVYYDTLSACTFDFGAEYDNYHGFYSTAEIENGDLDYYLFAGPSVREVVARFTELTGRMALGPRWSLGYANTAMSLADAPDAQQQLSTFIDRAREEAIPVSAFHYGSGYSSRGKRRFVFTWNRDKFPDAKALNAKFRAANIRLVANIKPCLLDDHPAYAEVAASGAFVHDAKTGTPCVGQFWDGVGAHVDFTHPAGIRWWQQGLARQVLDYGIDAGWNDNNEYEIWDDWGEAHGFGQPIPIEHSRPLQALLMTRATFEEQARHKPEERVFTVTRAGCPGIQRYAQTWTGDNTTSWHTLRWNIRMGLTMSLSGLFNTGHDIGGFAGPTPDAELLVRWMQSGALNPRCIMNSWKADGRTNVPWLHPAVTPIIRDAILLRYRLLPYLYTQYWRAHRFGQPILRPTFFEFEDDPNAFDDCDEFMVGNALLVAPVVGPGACEREVYLPGHADGRTEWADFHTGQYYPGGQRVVVNAPLECLPLFVRAGAVLPMTDSDDLTKLHDEPSRMLRVYPQRDGLFAAADFTSELYEDDGLSPRHLAGDWTLLSFRLSQDASGLRLAVERNGRFDLPYQGGRIVLPLGETRPLTIDADAGLRWKAGDRS
jgi:alpha-glucosidase